MKKIRSASKIDTSIRHWSCLTQQDQRRPLRSRRHARRCAATSKFTACQTGCSCTRRRCRSGGGVRRCHASCALHRRHGVVRARLLRAKDVEAAVLALRARRRVLHNGPNAVMLCQRREKPVVSMSTSRSSIRRAAHTRRLYNRGGGPRGTQAWRGPRSSEGAGSPSTPFSCKLPRSKLNAHGASTPTNPRASDRTSFDNEIQALPKQ